MDANRARLEAATEALRSLLEFNGPADGVLKRYFRDHATLGQHDRAFIAELSFAVLRNLRLLQELGAQRSQRRLALAALNLSFGRSIRELAPLLRKEEETWLAELRGRDQSALPPAIRLSLPDWLWERLSAQYGNDEAEA